MSKKLEVSSGREWRQPREEGTPVQLPSGHVVALRPPDLSAMVAHGRVPDFLTGYAVDAFHSGIKTPGADGKPFTPEELTNLVHLLDLLCRESFVNPRVVDEPTADDEISLDDLDFLDKLAVLKWLLGPVDDLVKFREEQAGSLESLFGGENDQPEAEPALADAESVG